jgi:acetylornithine aminotransferase
LGHNHPRVNRAIREQLKAISHLGTRYPNRLSEEAAQDVLGIVGIDDGKCTFLSSGSEAVEFGVQAVRRVTERPLLLTLQNSYLAAYGSAGRKNAQEWFLFDWNTCTHEAARLCLDKIPFDRIGGFIFEPGGSGIGFVHFPPGEIVREIAQRVKQAGGLLMANEITTGMGRTGKWFGFQHYEFSPDIVALGKGLGNGYPVSAVAMKRGIAERLENGGFHYAQSHQNDPLGCSVAREVIKVFREGNWVEKGDATGKHFLDGLKSLEKNHPFVKEARGRGMLLGLEFHPHERFTAASAYRGLLEKGFLVGYYPAGNLLRFDPALTVKKRDISRFLECLQALLETANQRTRP